jgi:hypothetical protein
VSLGMERRFHREQSAFTKKESATPASDSAT